MDGLIRMVVFAIGAGLVAGTLLSATRTMILPRPARSLVTSVVFRLSRRLFRLIIRGRSYPFQDRVLALFSPLTLLGLAAVWLLLTLAGFTATFWSTGYGSVADSMGASGSSLLTLGFIPLETTFHRILAFTEAAIGLGLVALLISFLPSLYAAFGRREQLVALLEVRAGSPPSAVEMLTRFHLIGWRADLSTEWTLWETWFADVEESHTSYPPLIWLRSPSPDHSWVTAAGTVLDAASLRLSVFDAPPDPLAQLTIRAGYLALRRIADFFGLAYNHDPAPTDPISIDRHEFDEAVALLGAVGVPLRADLDQAWKDFAGWRVNYDTVLLRLAELVVAPYAPWISDRSPPDHRPPRLIKWGQRG